MAHRKKSSTPFDCDLLTSCSQDTVDTLKTIASHSNALKEERLSAEVPAKLDSSSVAAVVPSTLSPVLYDLFDQRHPLERNNVTGLFDFLPKELCNLVFSHLSIDDYSPMKIYYNTEYNPYALFAVRIVSANDLYPDRPDYYSIMTSFRNLILNMPESIFVDRTAGISFDDISKLRSLSKSHLDKLKVLFIRMDDNPAVILQNIPKIEDYLTNVSMLVLESRREYLWTEVFVFELRCMRDIERALSTIISNVAAFFKKRNLDGLHLLVKPKVDEQEFQLKEALIRYDESFWPALGNANIQSTIRWDWANRDMDPDEEKLNALERLNPCRIVAIDDEFCCDIEAITNLRGLTVASREFVGRMIHSQLTWLCWGPIDLSFENFSFSTLPMLQHLYLIGEKSKLSGAIHLEHNVRLQTLSLCHSGSLEVYTGDTMFELENLFLIDFHGTFCQPEKLSIRELEIDSDSPIDLVQHLSKQAKKVIYTWLVIDKVDLTDSDVFSNSLNLKIVMSYASYGYIRQSAFKPSCIFQRLTKLELKQCRVVISPIFFPNMSRLYLEECETTFSLPVDDSQRAYDLQIYRVLEVLEVRSARYVTVQKREITKSSSNESPRSPYLIAPRLHKLVLFNCTRRETFLINHSSCPDLKTFMWRGYSYNSLPFFINSMDGPIFPKLQELALDRLIGNSVKCNNLSSLLCIDRVSILSLTNYSFVDNLDQLSFSCRLANFSLPVVRSGWKLFQNNDHRTNEAQCTAIGEIIRQQMRNIELLMIDNFVVHSSPVEQIVKRLRGDAVSNSDDEKEDFDDDGWNENRNQESFGVDAFDDISYHSADDRQDEVGKKENQDDDPVVSWDDWS